MEIGTRHVDDCDDFSRDAKGARSMISSHIRGDGVTLEDSYNCGNCMMLFPRPPYVRSLFFVYSL